MLVNQWSSQSDGKGYFDFESFLSISLWCFHTVTNVMLSHCPSNTTNNLSKFCSLSLCLKIYSITSSSHKNTDAIPSKLQWLLTFPFPLVFVRTQKWVFSPYFVKFLAHLPFGVAPKRAKFVYLQRLSLGIRNIILIPFRMQM